jgi:hypothetical protein
MKIAVAESLLKSHSYVKYRAIVSDLLKSRKVTGNQQSEQLTHYTQLNEARMNRLDKKTVIYQDNIKKLLSLKKYYVWLVISEGWCGDAAQILPILNKMAAMTKQIDLRIVLRDENDSLMNQFLTNGARSIPKLIVLEPDTYKVLCSWGPRPKGATDLITSYKRQYGTIDETAKTELQLWYLHDKGLTAQTEVADLMLELERLIYSKR